MASSAEPTTVDRLVGSVVGGKYRLVALVGQGGMGAVYRGRHEGLAKDCAVKILAAPSWSGEEARARFLQEARAACTVSHPNAVAVHDVDTDPATGYPYLVMDLLNGESLRSRLERAGRLSLSETLRALVPAMKATAQFNKCGIIHRDLKPENIFLHRDAGASPDEPPTPKILDFGVAKVMSAPEGAERGVRTLEGQWFGSIGYTAPIPSRQADAKADLFSFGVMLYECLDGNNPLVPQDDPRNVLAYSARVHRMEDHVELLHPKYQLPPALDSIVRRMISLEATDRYATLDEALRDLEGLEQSLGASGIRRAGAVSSEHPNAKQLETAPTIPSDPSPGARDDGMARPSEAGQPAIRAAKSGLRLGSVLILIIAALSVIGILAISTLLDAGNDDLRERPQPPLPLVVPPASHLDRAVPEPSTDAPGAGTTTAPAVPPTQIAPPFKRRSSGPALPKPEKVPSAAAASSAARDVTPASPPATDQVLEGLLPGLRAKDKP